MNPNNSPGKKNQCVADTLPGRGKEEPFSDEEYSRHRSASIREVENKNERNVISVLVKIWRLFFS